MKKSFLATIMFSCTLLQASAQIAPFEYLPYQQDDRTAKVQLPEFAVALKDKYINETVVYKEPSKLFVLSDIEGEYKAFKGLLTAAGVMDAGFNWTFGTGHLVLCGDMFDRGTQVAECLWLIYYLEEKAKAAGGYVHYILGNHELMNLTGDLRYLNPKYLELAKQKGVDYNRFYSNDMELGKWIRTKNIMEKIGSLLFLHGGVSPYMNETGQPLKVINEAARPYYDKDLDSLPPLPQLILSDYGPLWYRGYFMEPVARNSVVDSTLELFGVRKIIIGHTPVPRISAFYNNKVIDLDVPHAKGISEGLFIENKQYYRVSLDGKKVPLS